jgi:hypothetical protein
MLKIYPLEKARLLTYWEDPRNPANNLTTIGNFALVLISRMFELKKFVANSSQYF